ncbi:MAG: 3'-5' exonuclease [Bryobacteraceae bacterium]
MTTPNTLVFFDLETGGLNWWPHEVNGHQVPMSAITQIAALAIDRETGAEIGEPLEIKIKFREDLADPKALEINHYDHEVWTRDALAPKEAIAALTFWLEPHKVHQRVSGRTGRAYRVAELAGHNCESFDIHFLGSFFKLMGQFMPCDFRTLNTLQLAKFYHELLGVSFDDYKLDTLAKALGVALEGDAHDALVDVRTTVAIWRTMMTHLGGHWRATA